MSPANVWTAEAIPDLSGKTLIVTGGNSGLGFETTRALARRGARVVLACRNPEKAREAIARLHAENPRADVEGMALDLASLASVRAFAKRFLAENDALHGLVNNAGVMALPRCETVDGFEMQLGTNHFGHFALTGLLLEALLATPGSRVVNLSSTMHKTGRMRFDDLHGERSYGKWTAYGQSKLANLLFTYELQRRLAAKRAATISVASHPGVCRHEPPVRRPAHAGLRAARGRRRSPEPAPLPERRDGRAAESVCGDRPRRAGRRLLRPRRLRRDVGPAAQGELERPLARRERRGKALGDLRGRDGDPFRRAEGLSAPGGGS